MKDDFLKNRLWHKIVFAAAVAVLMLLMTTAYVYVRGIKAYDLAEEAYAAQDHEKAMTFYERTIRWYLPFNWRVTSAVQKLWEIGQQAEQLQNHGLALKAYRRLRSSLHAIENIYRPHDSWIDKCDSKLEILNRADLPNSMEDNHRPVALSAQNTLPHPAWSLLMEIGFWGWIICAVGLIWFGFNHQQSSRAKTGLKWTLMMIGFYGIWVVSLAKA